MSTSCWASSSHSTGYTFRKQFPTYSHRAEQVELGPHCVLLPFPRKCLRSSHACSLSLTRFYSLLFSFDLITLCPSSSCTFMLWLQFCLCCGNQCHWNSLRSFCRESVQELVAWIERRRELREGERTFARECSWGATFRATVVNGYLGNEQPEACVQQSLDNWCLCNRFGVVCLLIDRVVNR